MAINYDDYLIHVKKSGQKLKKFKCTCDECGADRGYLPKAKAFTVCLPCKRKDPTYIQKHQKAIKAVRSSLESREKTKQQIKTQKENGWKPAIIGKPMTMGRRIAHSCGNREILIEDFDGFLKDKPEYRIAQCFRKQLRKCKQSKVNVSTDLFLQEKLGYSFIQLKSHLESKFELWMTWNNHGNFNADTLTWQIDHIVPLKFRNIDNSYFWNQEELQDPDSITFKKAWSLDNLQPLSSLNNIRKCNRYIG